VPAVTAIGSIPAYLLLIGSVVDPGMELKMFRLAAFCAAFVLFAPVAYAALVQASQMIA
jgi:hypothetical protein